MSLKENFLSFRSRNITPFSWQWATVSTICLKSLQHSCSLSLRFDRTWECKSPNEGSKIIYAWSSPSNTSTILFKFSCSSISKYGVTNSLYLFKGVIRHAYSFPVSTSTARCKEEFHTFLANIRYFPIFETCDKSAFSLTSPLFRIAFWVEWNSVFLRSVFVCDVVNLDLISEEYGWKRLLP